MRIIVFGKFFTVIAQMEIESVIVERQIYSSAKKELKLWTYILLLLLCFGLFCLFFYYSIEKGQDFVSSNNVTESSVNVSTDYTTVKPLIVSTKRPTAVTTSRLTTKKYNWNPI